MDIAISKLKTGYIVGEWDDKVYSARQAFSTLDDLIAALPGILEPVDSAPPEIEPISAPAIPPLSDCMFEPVESVSEANGAADADPA